MSERLMGSVGDAVVGATFVGWVVVWSIIVCSGVSIPVADVYQDNGETCTSVGTLGPIHGER